MQSSTPQISTMNLEQANDYIGTTVFHCPLNIDAMDTFVDTQQQCSFSLKCALCHHVLNFLSTIDYHTLDGKTFIFSNVWSLECRHLVDSDCAYQLLEHHTMRSLFLRPKATPTYAFPIMKVWHCPKRSCVGIYSSVYSHWSHGWMLAPDSKGHIKAMVPYATMHQFLGPLALHFAPVHGTLEDLKCLGLKLHSLCQGIRGRWWPTAAPVAVEYMTHQYIVILSTRDSTDLDETLQVHHPFSSHCSLHLLHHHLSLWLSWEWIFD